MKPDEIRALSTEEILNRLDEAYEEMLNLRVQHGIGQLPNPLRMREVRRDIARMKTVLRERELWELYQAWQQQQDVAEE
ncbi:MAG: 50S ribosomal protein L29 [Chloroflexi bacterium]|nr:MAG: 50S ribosomal protein L29 [Chloroflexota bacterium]